MHESRRWWCSTSQTRHARWRGSVTLSPAELLLQPEENICQLYDVSLLEARALLRNAARTYSGLGTTTNENTAPATPSSSSSRAHTATSPPHAGIEVRRVYDMLPHMPQQQQQQQHDNDGSSSSSNEAAASACGAWAALPTGVTSLDIALMGGLRRGFVTELTGCVGCGKTVLACQWAVHAALRTPPLSYTSNDHDTSEATTTTMRRQRVRTGVMWLHTSASPSPSPSLLRGIVAAQHARLCAATTTTDAHTMHDNNGDNNNSGDDACACCRGGVDDCFCTVPVHDVSSFLSTTCVQLATFLEQQQQQSSLAAATTATAADTAACDGVAAAAAAPRIGLLVLDDLTVLVRREYTGIDKDTLARQEAVAAVLQTLKLLAERHHLAVLVLTNESSSGGGNTLTTSSGSVAASPSLSLSAAVDEDASDAVLLSSRLSTHPGAFGRMLYHAVNVRLRMAAVCCRGSYSCCGCYGRCEDACTDGVCNDGGDYDAGDVRTMQSPPSSPWLLHSVAVLKSPVCGAVRVLLHCSDLDAREVCDAHGTGDDGDDDGTAATTRSVLRALPYEDAHAMLDVLDYTSVPTFVYV